MYRFNNLKCTDGQLIFQNKSLLQLIQEKGENYLFELNVFVLNLSRLWLPKRILSIPYQIGLFCDGFVCASQENIYDFVQPQEQYLFSTSDSILSR